LTEFGIDKTLDQIRIINLTQNVINHARGPIAAPQGGFEPGAPAAVGGGGEVVETEYAPKAISRRRIKAKKSPTIRFFSKI